MSERFQLIKSNDFTIAFKQKVRCMQGSSAMVWASISVWLAGNTMVLWYFKEQSYWNASVCMVAS